MANAELVMPKMGESIMEATILKWLKKPGDKIEQDESVLEVATDKVDTEVPSTHAGVLKEILAKEGDVVKVGKPIAIIATEAGATVVTAPAKPIVAAETKVESKSVTAAPINGNGASHSAVVDFKSSSRFYSPLVKNIAKAENIAVAELETVPGSGAEGRVTKKDILAYVQNRKLGQSIAITRGVTPLVPAMVTPGDEIVPMDRMRKMIAERMVDSKRVSPHVTSYVEADVTNIVFWREKIKHEFQKKEGESITYTPSKISRSSTSR
jgi:2-oxoglutarate dehydrogenase E2 component (dihydrolipoamide succinyltransferase)